MKFAAVMTKTGVNPDKYDKEGALSKDGDLSATLKFDLGQFEDETLGALLLMLARGQRVQVSIELEQPEMDMTSKEVSIEQSDLVSEVPQ